MDNETVFAISFAKVYPILIAKAERKGSICGTKAELIKDPLMQNIRCLDKLVDELARLWRRF